MEAITIKSLFKLAIVLGTVASISLAGLTSCKCIRLADKEAAVKERNIVNTVLTANIVKGDIEVTNSRDDTTITEKYVSLIGQSKGKLILSLSENPVSIDEGGLEFKKAELRAWFKDYGKGPVVYQIFTQNKNMDINGVRIGDRISSFKKALGNQISDKNGEALFKYKDIFILVNYDIQSEDTVSVYFLKEYNN